MIDPETIVIEIEGGCVQSVRCTDPDLVHVIVIDRDNELYEDVEPVKVPDEHRHCDLFGPPEGWAVESETPAEDSKEEHF